MSDVREVPPDAHGPTNEASVARTPLHALHLGRGAKMVAFAGYEMPLQYPTGIIKEHLHTRSAAGLFDVSHMGQIVVSARSGTPADAARALESLLPIDVLGLPAGRQRYGYLTNNEGGILDDLMVVNLGDRLLLVVNAARKTFDTAHLRKHLGERCVVASSPDALIALQGPRAAAMLAPITPGIDMMRFLDVREIDILGVPCILSRSGYTGEDGFEISLPAERAAEIAEALLADADVCLVGLAARDSLRLEAGLCLYGSDIDETTSPAEAGLAWAIGPSRRRGGPRAGGFPGAERILGEIEHRASRRRVGLRPEGRAPVRAPAPLFAGEDDAEPIGAVTSGGFGPSLQLPIAMGYVPSSMIAPGTRVFAEVRGRRLASVVTTLPFVPPGFKRG